jgi:hypothetical protein
MGERSPIVTHDDSSLAITSCGPPLRQMGHASAPSAALAGPPPAVVCCVVLLRRGVTSRLAS